MSYKIVVLSKSEREIKRLAKKYRSFKAELLTLFAALTEQPQQGEPLAGTVSKFAWPSVQKGRGRVGEHA